MRKLFFVPLFLSLATAAQAQHNSYGITDSVKTYLDKSLDVFQTYALHRAEVDWPRLRETAYAKAAGATTYEALTPLYPFLFEQVQDHHGWYSFRGKKYGWSKPTPPYANAAVLDELKKKPGVRVRILNKNVGYLLIPGNSDFGMSNVTANAQAIRDSICRVQQGRRLKGWIVDLRLNDGGNMYPMLAGLGSLLGDGLLGGFVEPRGESSGQWIIRKGDMYVDTNRVTRVLDRCPSPKKNVPVAVLLSGRTASAGEVVAISFAGRPNARSFGEPSAGYTTANDGHKLPGGAGLTLAGTYEVDRNSRAYIDKVLPDVEIIGGDNFTTFADDQKIRAALRWLKKAR
ncbi:hypothetical protein E5K00_00250 [Hymenobacter aquaticus]|uniref:Tail specific protease domain-containing protein n=1 Tax=Hymenobacter aquaticus TaxID=1867101 RepID=A0A4Z0Q122_9BACT|nr:S41 family peptidase [Hymenobacter aquaticus]TGE23677.1 hypothetical protein E5K00_00250 [Hymenobacter aquaticus]